MHASQPLLGDPLPLRSQASDIIPVCLCVWAGDPRVLILWLTPMVKLGTLFLDTLSRASVLLAFLVMLLVGTMSQLENDLLRGRAEAPA